MSGPNKDHHLTHEPTGDEMPQPPLEEHRDAARKDVPDSRQAGSEERATEESED